MDRLGLMETYIRVLEAGSFTNAARQLNIGQPAVSKSIAQLEKQLGVRLLIRSRRSMKPSEAGQLYYEHARRTIAEAEEAVVAVRATDARLAGRLRVSADTTLTKLYLVPRLSTFLATHPDLSIEFVLHDGTVDLVEEGVDIGLRYGPLCDSALVARKIASTRRLVLGTPGYFARVGIPKSPDELLDREAVIYTHDLGWMNVWQFRKNGTETATALSGRLRLNVSEAVRAAVLRGLGFTIAPQWAFAPDLASGAVRPVLTEWALPDIELWVVLPMGKMTNAKARAFAAFVEREINRPGADWNAPGPPAADPTPTRLPVSVDDETFASRFLDDSVGAVATSSLSCNTAANTAALVES